MQAHDHRAVRLHTPELELGHDAADALGIEHPGGHAAAVLQGDVALHAGLLGGGAGEEQVAALAQPDVDAHLAGKVAADVDRLLHQADVELGGPLHAHAAAVASRGAARQVALLQHRDVAAAAPGQLVGDTQANDAAADDDGLALACQGAGAGRKAPHGLSPWPPGRPLRASVPRATL